MNRLVFILILYNVFIGLLINTNLLHCFEFDEHGYITYCPCMGRFGNQAEHFLGSLAFAKGLNRTLVLPPWVEYRTGEAKSIQVPFDDYFEIKPLLKYHRVILMNVFMDRIAPIIWPAENRTIFCYTARSKNGRSCDAKKGNPFASFWDSFNVDFTHSELYAPLNYDVHYGDMGRRWSRKYPAYKWPVLAFTGAPASFPIQSENRVLHKYLKWNDKMQRRARSFIAKHFPRTSVIGIHLRNGVDWEKACQHVPHVRNLFSSAQCLGYRNEFGNLTSEICNPSQNTIVQQLKQVINNFDGSTPIKTIFVASDHNHMLDILNTYFQPMKINVYKLDIPNPHIELIILAMSNHFIGNCVSSYSAFVKRERDVSNFPSEFWSFSQKKQLFHDPKEL